MRPKLWLHPFLSPPTFLSYQTGNQSDARALASPRPLQTSPQECPGISLWQSPDCCPRKQPSPTAPPPPPKLSVRARVALAACLPRGTSASFFSGPTPLPRVDRRHRLATPTPPQACRESLATNRKCSVPCSAQEGSPGGNPSCDLGQAPEGKGIPRDAQVPFPISGWREVPA